MLKLDPIELRLGLLTASDLAPELKRVKQALSLATLVDFECAVMHLDAFTLERPFATEDMLLGLITAHYKQEVLRQAYKIVGSVDLLGNPLGTLQTMSAGVQEFVSETQSGNLVGGSISLAQHVTHGLADSVSKLTGSISTGLGKATMDRDFQQRRARERMVPKDSAGHVYSGVSRLARGVVSGVSGLATQPLKGARKGGAGGFLEGVVQGLVGVVAKPVAGVFDLASETTAAVRHSAGPSVNALARVRLPRAVGPDLVLRNYRASDARGRSDLLKLNGNNAEERFVAQASLGLRRCSVIVTSERVLILDTQADGRPLVNSEVWFSGLFKHRVIHCAAEAGKAAQSFLQFTVSGTMMHKIHRMLQASPSKATPLSSPTWGPDGRKQRVRVRCDSEATAEEVAAHVLFALQIFQERRQLVGGSRVGGHAAGP